MQKYWLMKSEPTCFGIDALAKRPKQTAPWDGVRNYQARNFMRDEMHIGDQAFFYHSSCKTPGIVGIIEIVSAAYPDHTAFDPSNQHFDSQSTPDNPRWIMVDVMLQEKFEHIITLEQLRLHPQLNNMPLLKKGNRLSITPVQPDEWIFIMQLVRKG